MVIWCNARWTQRVWFLHSTSDGFKFDISRALQIRLFAPKELVPTGELNIVHRGEAMYNGKVLTRGQTWGEDIILSSVRLRKSNPSPNPNPNPTPTPNQVRGIAISSAAHGGAVVTMSDEPEAFPFAVRTMNLI